MYEQFRPMVQYFGKLVKRMESELRFPPNDPLLGNTRLVYLAMRDLLSEVHYLSCRSGVGRPEK